MRSSFLKNINNSYFSGITKKITIISIALIILISYGLFFYLQNNTESSVGKQNKGRTKKELTIISMIMIVLTLL
jgi:hypothetical protein